MVRTTLLVVTLFLGTALVKARHPSMSSLRGTPSYSCNNKYLVAGRDFVTCEMEVSGNNSDYTYNYHQSPRFQLQDLTVEKEYSTVISNALICEPFTTPQEGFCVNRDIVNTTGCSCEVVGHQIYRVKVVYRITDVYWVRRRIRLQWPSTTAGDIGAFYDLPEARDSCEEAVVSDSDSEECSAGCIVGLVFGVVFSIIIISLVIACLLKAYIRHNLINKVAAKREPEMPSPPPYEECVNSKGVTSDISLYTPPTSITVTTHDQSSPNFSIYGNIPNEASPPTATIDPQTEQGKSTTN